MKRLKVEKSKTRWYGIAVTSGCDEYPGCKLILKVPNRYITYRLPQWVKPYREQRDGYVAIDAREYGVSLYGNHLSVNYGRSTFDSDTDMRKGWLLPWGEWRHVRYSVLVADSFDGAWYHTNGKYDTHEQAVKCALKRCFLFADFDGQLITATTYVEEREWKRGVGYFKWLSLLWPNQIRRLLTIRFSAEVGREKGSWKGGTTGHGIEMQNDERHEDAFKRYCAERKLIFKEVLPC